MSTWLVSGVVALVVGFYCGFVIGVGLSRNQP